MLAAGRPVASAGDVNNDGFSDLIVGALHFDTTNMDAGAAFLYRGGSAGLALTPSWTSSGDDQAGATFGTSVASAGDLNNDGFFDVIVGASGFDTGNPLAGKAYVFMGGPSGLSLTSAWVSSGEDKPNTRFGGSVASASDVNMSGVSEVIIGASVFDTLMNMNAGKAYVFCIGP